MPTPPYRADHVGSLLRPEPVKRARRRFFEEKSIDREELRDVEDAAIRDLVRLQQDAGLPVATDGETRRAYWHFDFMGELDGMEIVEGEANVKFAGVALSTRPVINEKLDFPADHPTLEHYRFLASVSSATPKISIPGPSCVHFRTRREDIAPAEYRDDEEALFADITATYRKAVKAFYAAGCRYLSLLGGVYYSTSVIPEVVRPLASVVPLTYGLRALRRTLLSGEPLSICIWI